MALLKPSINLSVEIFHGTSMQGFRYDQKSFSYIKSTTPKLSETTRNFHLTKISLEGI